MPTEITTTQVQPAEEIPMGYPSGEGYGPYPTLKVYPGTFVRSNSSHRPVSYQIAEESDRRVCFPGLRPLGEKGRGAEQGGPFREPPQDRAKAYLREQPEPIIDWLL